ncbi:peptidoglycan DD-metalloendopeptidase family protein [Paenibacillus sp. sgz302251]|uniref:M23 family metallopeptidase n=1 Tax=Paenibacillus sp. sgz302251 TaxID=3414493 RepID=UPI003C79BEC0
MKQARKPKWSFVVMRGADKTVKQFHVSKRSVFAAPTAIILAVSGCIAGLQFKSAYELRHLEAQLAEQDAYFAQTVSVKDEAIVSLQQEIVQLSHQAQELETKVGELQELEQKLQQFIAKYGNAISPSSTRSTPADDNKPSVQILSAMKTDAAIDAENHHTSKQFALLAQSTGLELETLTAMVDTMEYTMAQTLRLAHDKRTTVDAYPSSWPTSSKQLTSGFGYRSDPFTGRTTFHAGIDIAGKLGDPIFSAADGTVAETGYDSELGWYVIIDHLGDLQSEYMHLSQIEAKKGDIVVRGEKIGLLGTSGRSTGPHLHFQIMQKNKPANPLKFLVMES